MAFVNIFFAMCDTFSEASLNQTSATYSNKKTGQNRMKRVDTDAARERGLQNTIHYKKGLKIQTIWA